MRVNTRCYGRLEGVPPNPGRSKKALRGTMVKRRQNRHQTRSVRKEGTLGCAIEGAAELATVEP